MVGASQAPPAIRREIEIDGLRLSYREAGEGKPVLLLHGWPTSSYLWRAVLPEVGRHRRAIALDLPGFGHSDKPLDVSYSFRYHARVLDGFVAALGLDRLGLAVHDLGGPIGLFWACQNQERIRELALLNTVVYPEMSWAVMLFVISCKLPGTRHWLTSPAGIRFAMRLGVRDKARLDAEVLRAYQEPFDQRDARRALARTAFGLSPKGFVEIRDRLPAYTGPVRIVYGRQDRILPDVARTMARVAKDLPQAETTVLDNCGHFLQEDRPDEVGQLLGEFFAHSGGSG